MKMKFFSLSLLALLSAFQLSTASSILVFMPSGSKSHKAAFQPLFEELLKRNHTITIVTSYKSSKEIKGITEIFLEFAHQKMEEFGSKAWEMSTISPLSSVFMLKVIGTDFCDMFYEDPVLAAFVAKPKKYDLVLVSAIFNDCYLHFVGTLGAPVVMFSPSVLWPDVAWQMDIPHPWSYIPFLFLDYSSDMSFAQRTYNTMLTALWVAGRWFWMHPQSDAIVVKHIPNAPSIREVIKNVSFILVNSHFSLDDPKPSMPYLAEVGAMHCRPAMKLPQEFDALVQESGNDGFIVFSMGSVVESQYLPKHIIDAFKEAFSKVNQLVIWKFEKPLEGLSPNVKIFKWIPQQDLIGHQKCRLAITHGGLLSLQEVAYHGVPLVGMPIGADRDGNLNRAVQKGFAEILDWRIVNANIILEKITQVLKNKRYKEKALEMSLLMKDRPETAVNAATYWVEYVIRHKGAKHLRSGAEHLNFFQYFLLDVLLVFVTILIVALSIFLFIIRKLAKFVCSKTSSSGKKSQKKAISKKEKSQ